MATSTSRVLEECGARLSAFERPRVARAGCGVALFTLAAAAAAAALGMVDTGGSWAAGFRIAIVSALAAALIFFLSMAAAEHLRERSVWRALRSHMRETGVDLGALRQAAEARKGRLPGGAPLAALLKDPPE